MKGLYKNCLYKKFKIWSDSKADVTEIVKRIAPNAKPCPCCGKLVDTPYCPICGFKMDEEVDNG